MDIIEVGKVVSALLVILGAIASSIKFFSYILKIKSSIDKYFEETEDYRKVTDEKIKECLLSVLKLIIMNKELSIEERIEAGDKYLKLGGNGYVGRIYKNLLSEINDKN